VSDDDLQSDVLGDGLFASVPAALSNARELRAWEKDFSDYLYHNISVSVFYNPILEIYGEVGDDKHDFRVKCEEEARKRRDEELEEARAKIDKQVESVKTKLRREERELKEDEADLQAHKREELLSIGESALNLLTGRRSSAMISRASRKRRMTQGAKADVEESLDTIADYEEQIEALEETWQEQADEIKSRWADALTDVEVEEVRPRRTDVRVLYCSLAWAPTWRVTLEDGQILRLPAREQPA
jgi:hypothetical protein